MSERQKCGCGNTKNVDGYCDGSHMNTRRIYPKTQLVKEEKENNE